MSRLYPLLLAFTITLAAVIGWRLPAEARTVTIGVLAGVAASIPTSLLVAWIAARVAIDRYAARQPHPLAHHPAAREPAPEPRIIFVQTPAPPGEPPRQSVADPWRGADAVPTFARDLPGPRHFTLLGDTLLSDE